MTLRELNEWMDIHAVPLQEGEFTPLEAVRLCVWKLSDKVDVEGWHPVFVVGKSIGPS